MTWQFAFDWLILPTIVVALICGAALWGAKRIP
jgi:hypothetical protein